MTRVNKGWLLKDGMVFEKGRFYVYSHMLLRARASRKVVDVLNRKGYNLYASRRRAFRQKIEEGPASRWDDISGMRAYVFPEPEGPSCQAYLPDEVFRALKKNRPLLDNGKEKGTVDYVFVRNDGELVDLVMRSGQSFVLRVDDAVAKLDTLPKVDYSKPI